MKHVRTYLIIGFIFASVLGTLSHFFYDWSGESPLIGLFSPVSESTWEHMKLIFFPILLYSAFMPAGLKKDHPALPAALLMGSLIGTFSIPVLFYTYSGILGRDFFPADIAVFFAGLLIAFFCAWIWKDSETIYRYRLGIFLITAITAMLFFVFTFLPPDIGLFAEP